MKLEVKSSSLSDFKSRILKLTGSQTLVGIPDTKAPRTPEEEEAKKASGEPLSNADLGYIHEFGIPEVNIPERPFLVPGIRNVKERLGKVMASGARAVISGQDDGPEKVLNKVGLIAEAAVKQKIEDGPFTPLAPRTLEERKRRGRTGEKPLIDTAQMQNAVTYVIRDRK